MAIKPTLPPRPPFGANQAITSVLVLVTLGTTFLPWGRSGERARNSYELVDVAGNAGVIPDGWQSVAPTWFLLPIICASVLLALFTPVRRLPGILSATVGASVASTGLLVLRSPLVPLNGVRMAIAAGGAMLLWGLVLVVRPGLGTRPHTALHAHDAPDAHHGAMHAPATKGNQRYE